MPSRPPTRNGTRPSSRWIRRLGSKSRGFRYVAADGRPVRDARTRERIDALRIPPGWREVRIAPGPGTPIQAWGLDDRGRRQYVYSERAVRTRELRKHYRVRQLARDLPRIRRAVLADLRRGDLSRENVAATVLRVIDLGGLRIGSERYARENSTFGITTLRKVHVRLEGEHAVLSYVGKRNIEQRHVIADAGAVRMIALLLDTPGTPLFRFLDEAGWHDLSAEDVNEYLERTAGFPYTAKDFRTWNGTLRAATVLAELGPARSTTEAKRNVATAMRLVAADLGNTPAICRASYVHPVVIERYVADGETIALARRRAGARSGQQQMPEERALIGFLARHFPERRRRRRLPERAGAA